MVAGRRFWRRATWPRARDSSASRPWRRCPTRTRWTRVAEDVAFAACDASRRCDGCGVARTCERCARGFAREAHARECHALRRLAQNDAGLSSRTRIRLLLRLLARRSAAPRLDADADDANLDPAAEAAARDGDVIVDDYDAVLELMSGLQGGDDGLLSDDAVATLHEVAKQCKYLVDPQLAHPRTSTSRSSVDSS